MVVLRALLRKAPDPRYRECVGILYGCQPKSNNNRLLHDAMFGVVITQYPPGRSTRHISSKRLSGVIKCSIISPANTKSNILPSNGIGFSLLRLCGSIFTPRSVAALIASSPISIPHNSQAPKESYNATVNSPVPHPMSNNLSKGGNFKLSILWMRYEYFIATSRTRNQPPRRLYST